MEEPCSGNEKQKGEELYDKTTELQKEKMSVPAGQGHTELCKRIEKSLAGSSKALTYPQLCNPHLGPSGPLSPL